MAFVGPVETAFLSSNRLLRRDLLVGFDPKPDRSLSRSTPPAQAIPACWGDRDHHARYAARRLGIDIDVVEELAEQMSPEDGRVSVVDSLDENAESTTAFTRRGLDYLEELLDDRRSEFMKDV